MRDQWQSLAKRRKGISQLKGTSEFTATHALEVGCLLSEQGIPLAAALELVNKWNRSGRGWKYWIE